MQISENINNKLNDQDFRQKLNFSALVILELYKVLVSCLLILFVPQKCGDHKCSYSENMQSDNNVYSGGLAINFLTLCLFFILYIIEIKRENRLITYLEVNITKPCDNQSVGNALNYLPEDKKQSIISLDKIYQKIGQTSIIVFTANSILSGIIIYNYYLDSHTTTTFVTNLFFMTSKIYDVYVNVATEENVFYSAYLKSKVQYNDVDPNKKIEMITIVSQEKEKDIKI